MTKTQVYALGPIMDQGETQSCVGHGWTLFYHERAAAHASFWFDTLQRFITIRANGRAPGENELPTKKRET